MKTVDLLASSLGRRDEVPNQELAATIVKGKDIKAVAELFENLHHKNKDIQSDCIKVIYEIGEANPKLIAAYDKELLQLLQHKNNRLQWGAMTALSTIVAEKPELIFQHLSLLIAASEQGSVITKDKLMLILIKLASIPQYETEAFLLLNEQLISSSTNQFPMYAEQALAIINAESKSTFIKTLSSRLPDIEKESKRKRVEKVLQKLQK